MEKEEMIRCGNYKISAWKIDDDKEVGEEREM